MSSETVFLSDPSNPITVMDVAGPESLSATFMYNFYTPDETINDKGYSTSFANMFGQSVISGVGEGVFSINAGPDPMTAAEAHAGVSYAIQREIPRYITINITGISASIFAKFSTDIDSKLESLGLVDSTALIKANLGTGQDDSSLSTSAITDKYVTLSLQDNDLHMQIARELLLTKDIHSPKNNSKFETEQLVDWISNKDGDYTNNIRGPFGAGTTGDVGEFFRNAIAAVHKQRAGVYVVPPEDSLTGTRQGTTPGEDMSAQNFVGQINPQCFSDLLMTGLSNAMNPFSSDFANDVELANLITANYKGTDSSTDSDTYNVPITPIAQSEVQGLSIATMEALGIDSTADMFNDTQIVPLGYILDKFEMLNGTRYQHTPIIFGNWKAQSGLDTKVKVGSRYFYQARAVYLVKLKVVGDNNEAYSVWALFLSKPSASGEVVCEAYKRPPNPPNEIKFIYDFTHDNLTIHWNFPVEPQRDVKYFQIFRRTSFLEPFQLIKEYDFNDIILKEPYSNREELGRINLIEKMVGNARTFYTDNDFNKNSSFIYAIAALDAHENISNYSTQFQVSFDRFKNQLQVDQVSPSGAPRCYPNFFLAPTVDGIKQESILVEDAIKVSKHRKFSVYLDSHALKILKEDPENNGKYVDAEHLVFSEQLGLPGELDTTRSRIDRATANALYKFNREGKYLMQIINMDNGKTEELSLRIEDSRVPGKIIPGYVNPFAGNGT